ncbi:MAG: serine hydrolase domain-containing protein, partial [Planctomycetota bacterium]
MRFLKGLILDEQQSSPQVSKRHLIGAIVVLLSCLPWLKSQLSGSRLSKTASEAPAGHIEDVLQTRVSFKPRLGNGSLNDLTPTLDQIVPKLLEQQRIPGLAVIVVQGGKTVFQGGYGVANVENKTPVDPESTLFRIGSVSKALTFLALTSLIDQGKLDRSANVEQFVGDIQNLSGDIRPVTVDHLLTHTAGFDQIGTGRHIFEHHLGLKQRMEKRPSLFEFLSTNLRRVSSPGELFRYDTYGTTLAGAIIAKVTKKPYADAMHQQLFEPLGMTKSSVEVIEEHRPDLATGYGWVNGQFVAQPYEVYVTTPASSIDATPADMGRLLEALTADGANTNGRLLSEDANDAVLSPGFRCHPEFVGITHGFFESYTSQDGTTEKHLRTIGHGGSMNGYRSALTIIPEKQVGIFIVANRSPEAGGGTVDFRSLIDVVVDRFEDAPSQPKYAVVRSEGVDLAPYVGDYHYGVYCHAPTAKDLSSGAWRRPSPRVITAEKDVLVIGDERFVPQGKDVFVQVEGERRVFFGRNRSGQVSHFVYSTSPDTFEKASTSLPYPQILSLAQRAVELSASEGMDRALEFLETNHDSESYYCDEQEV